MQRRSRWSKTGVARMLVGDEGMTYFYNGVRMFAHPWLSLSTMQEKNHEKNGSGKLADLVSEELDSFLLMFSKLNEALKSEATRLCPPNDADDADKHNFNISLVNYMDSSAGEEPYYGMGNQTLAWHHDDSVQAGTTIAVYSALGAENNTKTNTKPWKIGLKRAWDIKTPGVAVTVPDGSAYFMLQELNNTHQHCVLTGSGFRFSSTHRVGKVN